MRLLKKITFILLASMATCIVRAQDAALFQVAPGTSVCLGDTIKVTDFSTGGNGAVTYTFGDGTPSTSPGNPNPKHLYATANTFVIKQILPISGTVIDPVTGLPVGYLSDTVHVKVVPNTSLSATYTVCGSGRVNLHIIDTRFDSYDVDFGDGSAVVNVIHDASGNTESVHIYSVISAHTVTIKGKFTAGNFCPAADFTLSVTPIAAVPKPDVVYLETTDENQTAGVLTVHVINNTPFTYSWDFKRNGFSYTSNLGTLPANSGTTAIPLDLNKTNTNPYNPTTQAGLHASYTLNTKQNSYCVRLATTTACGREVLSDEICSVTKFIGTAADLENDLTWEAYSGINPSSVDVIRDGTVLTSLGATASSYNDNAVSCAIEYTYRIKEILSTTSSAGPQYSLSAVKKVTATSLASRPALTNVNSTVNGSSITVTFDAVGGGFTAKSYNLLESVNGGAFTSVAANPGNATTFTVTGRNTSANSYCYQVNYIDLCNLSPANGSAVTTCPIKLNVGLAEDGTVAINWTNYLPSGTYAYTIEVRDENGTVIKTIPGGSGNSASDLLSTSAGQLYYIVIATDGTTTSNSTLVELQLSPAVFVPDAFSPNQDGHNDYFELKGRFIKDINLSVFNRWGEPVFHSTDMKNQWDGKVNGGDANVGTYAYTLEVTGFKGEVIKQKGTITLVR